MADHSHDTLLRQFLQHAWKHKLFWIMPIVVVFGLMALLLLAGHSSAPFRYTLF